MIMRCKILESGINLDYRNKGRSMEEEIVVRKKIREKVQGCTQADTGTTGWHHPLTDNTCKNGEYCSAIFFDSTNHSQTVLPMHTSSMVMRVVLATFASALTGEGFAVVNRLQRIANVCYNSVSWGSVKSIGQVEQWPMQDLKHVALTACSYWASSLKENHFKLSKKTETLYNDAKQRQEWLKIFQKFLLYAAEYWSFLYESSAYGKISRTDIASACLKYHQLAVQLCGMEKFNKRPLFHQELQHLPDHCAWWGGARLLDECHDERHHIHLKQLASKTNFHGIEEQVLGGLSSWEGYSHMIQTGSIYGMRIMTKGVLEWALMAQRALMEPFLPMVPIHIAVATLEFRPYRKMILSEEMNLINAKEQKLNYFMQSEGYENFSVSMKEVSVSIFKACAIKTAGVKSVTCGRSYHEGDFVSVFFDNLK